MKDSIVDKNELVIISSSIDSLRYQMKSDAMSLKTIIEQNSTNTNFIKGVSNNTVFTVSITLFIFIIGIVINEIIKKIEKLIEQKKIRSYFKYHIDRIKDFFTINLVNAYKEYYQNVTIDSGILRAPPKVLSNDFERIKKIESKELFHSIRNKTELSRVLSHIDYFDKLLSEVNSFHNKALLKSDQLREELNVQINQYVDLLVEFVEFEKISDPGKIAENPHIKYFNESFAFYYKNILGKRALRMFYRKIIRPNQKYLVDSQLFRTHIKGKDLARLGKDISYKYNELKIMTIEVKLQFRKFKLDLEESRNVFIENIDKINWG